MKQILKLFIVLLICSCNKIEDKKDKNIKDSLASINIKVNDIINENSFCSDGSMVTDAVMYSQGPDYVPYFNNEDTCFNNCFQTWRTNPEWRDCINQHRNKWEKLIKLYYDSLLLELEPKGREILIEYQSNWEKQIESETNFFNYYEENTSCFGKGTHFIGMNANMNRYRVRAIELYTYLNLIKEDKEFKKDSQNEN